MGHRNACIVLIRKPGEKTPLGRPRCRWENSIRMDVREMDGRVWNGFIWLRLGTSGRLL
jgi:hypothetical protein